jgi:hypothetical protein
MIQTGFDVRIKTHQIIENQLPEFILDESPKAAEFLKQYYISQEFQSGPVDIIDNLDQYLNLDNLVPEVVIGFTKLTSSVLVNDTTINVESTKGFPNSYGLFKIDNEIITYTSKTPNSFVGCVRGFSGITSYRDNSNPNELVFSSSVADSHTNESAVQNLSSLFLKEFYKKLKYTYTPDLENVSFVDELNVGNFIKESRSLYQSKGTNESFKILYNVLYGITPKVIDLENYLIKPSSAEYLRRKIIICQPISGNPNNLVGQTIESSISKETRAAVSEVEIYNDGGKEYYKLGLFIGFSDEDLIEGDFPITPLTKVIGIVNSNDKVITVDSTIGFPESGVLICSENKINYTEKTINQFLGCTGISEIINSGDEIISNQIVFGYENGDLTKKVELKVFGSISDLKILEDFGLNTENTNISVQNLGEVISNFSDRKTDLQIFANSFVYNTSCTFEVDRIEKPIFTLSARIDKSNLAVGDTVEIINIEQNLIAFSNARVSNIDRNNNQITLSGIESFNPIPGFSYKIRRNLKKSISTLVPIKYGNDVITADVQNLYVEPGYAYVASNSLPSYSINVSVASTFVGSGTSESEEIQQSIGDGDGLNYSIISFPSAVPFITGDSVRYYSKNKNLVGLESGRYFVEVVEPNKIKLFDSPSFIYSSQYRRFTPLTTSESSEQVFILDSQYDREIESQKLLRKIPTGKNVLDGNIERTTPGGVGISVNGIEILNYKSDDRIYYGPLTDVNTINSGENYDVINPPKIEVSSSGISSTALIQPVIRGSVKSVFVDPSNVDIDKVISFNLIGGNGKEARLEPVLETVFGEFEFDAREIRLSGGVDIDDETITFLTPHNFIDGEVVVYNSNGNPNLGIGTFGGDNYDTKRTLSNNAKYYVKFFNSKTIRLFPTEQDYNSGVNTVGFTTISTSGIHKIRSLRGRKVIRDVKIANPGFGYENRKLYVNSTEPSPDSLTGISTQNNLVYFKNHDLNDGDLIEYVPEGIQIAGLATESQYFVLKNDDDSFRLAYAGIGGTITEFYNRRKYEKLPDYGQGYQIFKYPDIYIESNILFTDSSLSGIITATPIIRGEIVDAYLYENGAGYGSSVINFEKKPVISIKTGYGAEAYAVAINGRIRRIEVKNRGQEYYSTPDIIIEGDGQGARARAVIQDGRLVEIILISSGIGYSSSSTKVRIVSAGMNAKIESNVRSLQVNESFRTKDEYLQPSTASGLKYSWVAYPYSKISQEFNDIGAQHSPIIAWAYDGNPIYGPYGYSDPVDSSSGFRLMKTGYISDISSIQDRPPGYSLGFFIDDYKYVGSQDLDVHNGRFCKTPEFPNGVYAYFAGITTDGLFNPSFPYFIGDRYKSFSVDQTDLNQSFDFNNSLLFRNTFPYRIGETQNGIQNDFITISANQVKQESEITGVFKGKIDSIDIIDPGNNYAVNDVLIFDNAGTSGDGAYAIVSSIRGRNIVDLTTNFEQYNVNLIWRDENQVIAKVETYHTIDDGDTIGIIGISTNIRNLSGYHEVGVSTERLTLLKELKSSTSGIVTDIYVSTIPKDIFVGNYIGIGTELLVVLNIFASDSVLRLSRGISGIATHPAGSEVKVLPDKFILNVKTEPFPSKLDSKLFFNPKESIGLGRTSGFSSTLQYKIGDKIRDISVPTQSIYIPNHPFKTNQKLILSGPNYISVANTSTETYFNLLDGIATETVYAINKSKDYIGIVTQVGFTTTSDGLFFLEETAFIPNDYEFSLESDFEPVFATAQKAKSVVSIASPHLLRNGDVVDITTIPNSITGIGTSSFVRVQYSEEIGKIIINSRTFGSSDVDVSTNTITIPSHNFQTGDLVYYDWVDFNAEGLFSGRYFVYRVDNNNIQLCETLRDATVDPIITVDIFTQGGNQQSLGFINPQLPVVKGSTLQLDLSDPSLFGYEFKIFTDKEFKNSFVSIANTSTFTLSQSGIIGVSTDARLILNYAESLPSSLYYNVEKNGILSFIENEVIRYSEIYFIDSATTGSFPISGVGTTTFEICLRGDPESYNYTEDNASVLEYSTKSTNALGPIDDIAIISGGKNFKKVPVVLGLNSKTGTDGKFVAKSNDIGRISSARIINTSYQYPSDKTLRPQVNIPKILTLKESSTLDKIELIYGGANYVSAPDLVIVDINAGNKVDSGSLLAKVENSSITSVEVISLPTGMNFAEKSIFSVNNTNGVGIQSIQTSQSGIVTCFLVTPLLGFSTSIFSIGDEIFVERIEKDSVDGSGFNSEDYGFKFFTVSKATNTIPATVEYDLSQFTNNTGVGKTIQLNFANIVKLDNYPIFKITQKQTEFAIGESILVKNADQFVSTDLFVSDIIGDYIKLGGEYPLRSENVILGAQTGSLATIQGIIENKATYIVDYSTDFNYGWKDDVGKTNTDFQVIPDNDYYQNLSYSVKSPIEWEKSVDVVNRVLHTTGTKNFADTEVFSTQTLSIGSSTISEVAIYDLIENNRVDTIYGFASAKDVDVSNNRAKFIQLSNKTLVDSIICKTNRVLSIDDISGQFANRENVEDTFVDLLEYSADFSRFLVQVKTPNSDQISLTELVVLYKEFIETPYTLKKGSVFNTDLDFSDIYGFVDAFDLLSLKFEPNNPFDIDYDIKIIQDSFTSSLVGFGSTSIGFINKSANNIIIIGNNESNVISIPKSDYDAFNAILFVVDKGTSEFNFVEIYANHDGTNTFISEYYYDTNNTDGVSFSKIGEFDTDLEGDNFVLKFNNDKSSDILVQAKVIEFGPTSAGISTLRFILDGQIEGLEKSARFESFYNVGVGTVNILRVPKEDVSSLKSTVSINDGVDSALHQVVSINDEVNTTSLQYPYLSVGSTTGIGTFSTIIDGTDLVLQFYPDDINSNITLKSYSELIYSVSDTANQYPAITYGPFKQELTIDVWNAFNGVRINRTSFEAFNKDNPIFMKFFNPSDSSTLDLSTGTFKIRDHFFSTGEELIYRPNSTFDGLSIQPLGIGQTLNNLGILTNIMPSIAYAIKIDPDNFRLSSRREYAESGIAITFTSAGGGNSHELEMKEKLSKCLISVDDIIQSPLAYTPINYKLENNGGNIGIANTIVCVSGISSIVSGDVLKIDDEFMKVIAIGLGPSNNGPITGIGTFRLLGVNRGFVGTISTSHIDGSEIRIHKGSFNIEKNTIYFTDAPKGSGLLNLNDSNLPKPTSSFGGRVFLRSNYENNLVYDDISQNFTGIGQTFELKSVGVNTVGIETGSGILLLNGVYQTPSTDNNSGNNYFFTEQSGSSNVVFTGITSTDGTTLTANVFDVNQNALPRGGIIVSLGSTNGLGFAPLVGASVTAVVGAGGSIVSVGLGTTDRLGSGYNGVYGIGVSIRDSTGANIVPATVQSTTGIGGTLSFTIIDGGSGYVSPEVFVSEPSYDRLPVIGVSRLSVGLTTETGFNLLIDLEVGEVPNEVGIGSTLFQVSRFKISRPGYGFEIGDVFKPVGLITDKNLSSPLADFELTVVDVYRDSFALWQFGQLDYIDNIKQLQNGFRSVFPLRYNAELLSFEKDSNDPDSSLIDLNQLIIVFVNGVLQTPGISYEFLGGSSISFVSAPAIEDNISIYFYNGTRGVDIIETNTIETIKIGDSVRLQKPIGVSTVPIQNERDVSDIPGADRIETNLYSNIGISQNTFRLVNWTKQKVDKIINGDKVYKVRDILEPQVYPTSRLIKSFNFSDSQIFVDDASSFIYEENSSSFSNTIFGAIIFEEKEKSSARLSPVVGNDGTIALINILNGGLGYEFTNGTQLPISISPPPGNSGITAQATITVNNGSLSLPINITQPGTGYTTSPNPLSIVEQPSQNYQVIKNAINVEGRSGIITGISSASGIGTNLAVRFFLDSTQSLNVGYPIYIFDTAIGYGLTSIVNANDNEQFFVGREYLNNIYIVHSIPQPNEIICNVKSDSSIVGISSEGGLYRPVGRFSWGRISGFTVENSISFDLSSYEISNLVGLSTFPLIQRREFGLRNNGSYRKILPD